MSGKEDNRSDGTQTPAHAGADHQEAQGGRPPAGRGPRRRRGGEGARGLRADVATLAGAVRRPEGQCAKRLKELERENTKLKRIVAEQLLENQAPRWASLREEGFEANRKKIQRLWREEGLRVPARRRKRYRLGISTTEAARLRACRPDHVWALDFQFDVTSDGRILKLLHVVDEHTREALAIEVERRIDADRTVSVLERAVAARGRSPELLRMDNGPELTARALRDWCRFSGSGTSYIEPGSPWENRSWSPSPPASATRCSRWKPSTRCPRRRS